MSKTIQVLLAPTKFKNFPLGIGTLRNFTNEECDNLLEICEFQNMGEAKYEHGNFHKSIDFMKKNKSLYHLKKINKWFIVSMEVGLKSVFDSIISIEQKTLEDIMYQVNRLNDSKTTKKTLLERAQIPLEIYEFSQKSIGFIDLKENYMFFRDEKMAKEFYDFICR